MVTHVLKDSLQMVLNNQYLCKDKTFDIQDSILKNQMLHTHSSLQHNQHNLHNLPHAF